MGPPGLLSHFSINQAIIDKLRPWTSRPCRDELERLFKALRDDLSFGGTNLLTIILLLALGVRKCELLGAKWSRGRHRKYLPYVFTEHVFSLTSYNGRC